MEALLLLPFAIAIMFLSVMAYYEGEPEPAGFAILLLPLILLPLSTFLIYRNSSTSPSGTPWYGTVAIVILTIFKYTLILALFIAVFQFFSPIIIIIFLAGVYQYYQARKYGLMMDIISTIGTSMRQSLPLPMALTTAAYGQKRKEARIFNNIAHWLAQGWPLSEALRRGYWRCPSHILGAIATAEQMDQLPKAIESLQVDLSEKLNNYKTAKPVHPWYPVIVLIVISSIMTGLSIYIIPTFSEVLYDMSEGQASLPAATQSLLDFSSWMIGRKGLNALLVLTLFFWVIAFLIYSRFRRRTPCSPHFLSLIGDRIKWYTPVLHWFEKTFGNLYLVQSLRVGLLAGYPVNIILRNASGLDVNRCYQERLQKWLKKIEAGDNIAQSAKA
ncbi:MAG: type II secretion system F family protein, partial [Planctomycetota bacterium]